MSEGEVDTYVANNGYLTDETDPTVAASVKDGVDWTELTGIPSDIADGDDDTTYTFSCTEYSATDTDGEVTVPCTSGIVTGGGCDCSGVVLNGFVEKSEKSYNGWVCDCVGTGSVRATAICCSI